ncbi:protein-L-isoaspartate(D-aspartate) O-methyltransferase [Roseibium sp. AS2]|uniref:protein-L-isoaspartate(D-aspartate) O-methyltransferase n=1 Tax=Roseibium sp. AS2 TaxID=3135781 RepID=UPI00316C8D67
MDPFADERDKMVTSQLRRRGISDARVLAAMAKVPRHLFVSGTRRTKAYWDGPLAIGHYQTISQPYIVALMCEALALTRNCDCLDIGTGSGYAAAVLSELCRSVVSVERFPELAAFARNNLQQAGYRNIEVHDGDGSLGYEPKAPYDAISVAAAAPVVPVELKAQLKPGGRLVIPVGSRQSGQDLIRVTRMPDGSFHTDNLGSVAFVPLVGAEGWPEGN